uniref:Uncharacterized protein n=1 Tax=Sphaerodactylus townsendi TaxID=933632 RepID=A0ACB8ENL0_9SAUR
MGSEENGRWAWSGGGTLGVAVVSRWRMWPRGRGRKERHVGAGTVASAPYQPCSCCPDVVGIIVLLQYEA